MQTAEAPWEMLQTFVPSCVEIQNDETHHPT